MVGSERQDAVRFLPVWGQEVQELLVRRLHGRGTASCVSVRYGDFTPSAKAVQGRRRGWRERELSFEDEHGTGAETHVSDSCEHDVLLRFLTQAGDIRYAEGVIELRVEDLIWADGVDPVDLVAILALLDVPASSFEDCGLDFGDLAGFD